MLRSEVDGEHVLKDEYVLLHGHRGGGNYKHREKYLQRQELWKFSEHKDSPQQCAMGEGDMHPEKSSTGLRLDKEIVEGSLSGR